jgi:hypothetical protein
MIYSNNLDPALKELSIQYSKKDIHVMFAFKMKNGKLTNEQCLTFIVKDKLPLDQLSSENILPSELLIDNQYYPTDVVEIKNATTLSCPSPCADWLTTPPGNRNTVRPLVGGLSIGSKNNIVSSTECIKGTLGFIAVDTASQALVGVTASHVVVKSPIITVNQDLSKLAQNETNNYVYQNGETCVANPALQIGQVIRYVPLYVPPVNPSSDPNIANFVPYNFSEGALVSLKQSDISNTESFKQYGLDYNLPLPFATTNEINDLRNNVLPKIYSSGRTTGAKGNGSCYPNYIGIYPEGLLVNGYNIQGEDTGIIFANLLMIGPSWGDCLAFAPGDSGAAVIAEINGVRKIIGLMFAQATYGGGPIGIACRIDWLATQLGIEAWDGTPKNFIDPASIAYTTVPGKSYDSAIKKDGKIYWQVGLTNN